ncbi:MAG: hydrogenase formation protein HypD, partial [Deltaproteobacteria bacterium]|nr:hydrogenase formation protein HypD [Deltaproteobacteria bacterium]
MKRRRPCACSVKSPPTRKRPLNCAKEFSDPQVAARFLKLIAAESSQFDGVKNLMEVCGTHTMALFRHGIRSLLPEKIHLLSGPGCPVCVTPIDYIDKALALARDKNITLATFGDLARVPGSSSSLLKEKAKGSDLCIVYSPADAVSLAARHPERRVVFLAVGFETTAPTVGASILEAARLGLKNFFVLCAHKTIPEAMRLLAEDQELRIDGFLCPAHVSAIIGAEAYRPLAEERKIPCVITGFEP